MMPTPTRRVARRAPRNDPLRAQRTHPDADQFRADVIAGLRRPRKSIPSKYFYDDRGSRLFDEICQLEEYYLTRTELRIMRDHAHEMAARLGPRCCLIELGSGSSVKTRVLLDRLRRPAAYIPVDISGEHLARTAEELCADYPRLQILPVCADFTRLGPATVAYRDGAVDLPQVDGAARRVAYFPGSTIGNFHQESARRLLRMIAGMCGRDAGLLIGVDLLKDRAILERAYNDSRGVTAEFNLNLLRRINREIGGELDRSRFRHQAVFNEDQSRIEMHLVSTGRQTVALDGEQIDFEAGESIHTENSYKYSPDAFRALAASAGWSVRCFWTDPDSLFSVQYLHGAADGR